MKRTDAATLSLVDWLGRNVTPLTGEPDEFDSLMDLVGEARLVMIGEASHGTHEFYASRARLTQRLITEKGFNLVAIEGDWPDSLGVNRYVRGGAGSALESLEGFRRFPTWMWRNDVVLRFVEWLRAYNDQRPRGRAEVGFYGLDVYSLHASMQAVLQFLETVDPAAASEARARYACFTPFGADTQQYALSAHYMTETCEEAVIETLLDLLRRAGEYTEQAGAEAVFEAELNAVAVLNAERYYRKMVQGGAVTWNLRDRHMVATVNRLLEHRGPDARVVIWEHNSHIGDFRATYEGRSGHVNVGQLLREQYGPQVVAIGYGTYRGTVTAASRWDGEAEFKRVPPAREGSYESIFHAVGVPNFSLILKGLPLWEPESALYQIRDERAIGVVYDPAREVQGNYVPSQLANRYDAYLFYDETRAIEPLDPGPEPPGLETFPSGL